MTLNRRLFIAGCSTLALSACASNIPTAPRAQQAGLAPDLLPQANSGFDAWIAAFRPRGARAGISTATMDAAFAQAGFLPGVVSRDRNQIQSRVTFEDYLAITASDTRIATGRAMLARNASILSQIEARYGVDRHIVTAIWGVESQFGEKRGDIPVISSAATLAFDGRRGQFYESQLIAALRILQEGDTTPPQLVGSWAGAMGHTQFIPTSYQGLAVDFTGDGRRDIWSDDPTDSLASTANYLARNGWQTGLRWGSEAGTGGPSGRTVTPQAGGVSFTVTRNFDVIKTYNNSDFYAVGVGYLSDRIKGAGPLQGSFPPDANGLTRQDRVTVQEALTARGYDIGTIDGVIGGRSERAITDFQQKQGLPVTRQATRDVLTALR